MNAIIGLCHFCDTHGPRTLFCTQAFKYNEASKKSLLCQRPQSPPQSPSSLTSINITNRSSSSNKNSISSTPIIKNSHNLNRELTCKACRAFEENFHHYISYDNAQLYSSLKEQQDNESLISISSSHSSSTSSPENASINSSSSFTNSNTRHSPLNTNTNNNICYISQSTPTDSEVFALVRKACLRTLHCEVFEDPIYFDDDKDGSVIGYEFSIKDSEGRGLQRSYSLIIIMKDRIYLQHLWSFLSEQMSIIAMNIKKEAEAKFNKDIALLDDKINDSVNQIGINPTPSSSSLLTASASLTSSQRQTLYTKKMNSSSTSKQVRGLIELTDDAFIFAKLHMWFTWVLRMSQCQIIEEFMMGPLTEDFQVKFERERLNEAYANAGGRKRQQKVSGKKCSSNYNKLNMIKEMPVSNSKNENNPSLNNSNDSASVQFDLENNLTSTSTTTTANDKNNVNSNLLISKLNSNNSDANSNKTNFVQEAKNEILLNNFQIYNLRQLLKLFGDEYFHQIAYNTIIGNQVIIRGKYEKMVSSIIRTLEELIPFGCCKSVYYSNEYLKSYECRLLGISDKVTPFQSESATSPNEDDDKNVFSLSPTLPTKNVNFCNDLNDYVFIDIVIKPKENNNSASTVRSQFKNLNLDNVKIYNQVDLIDDENYFNIILKTNVCNNMERAPKILTKIESYLADKSLEDKTLSFLIKQAKEEWLNKTKVLYKFYQSPKVKNSIDLETVFKMLDLSKTDELAIKFWLAGLSDECKAQIRST